MQGIYQIKNLINNKIYIGQSTNILSRWNSHKSNYNSHMESSPLLYAAFNKYGVENFEFTILEEIENRELLNEKETYYIQTLNTLAPNGYNCILPTELLRGTNNIKNKISEDEVKEIKNLLINSNTAVSEIASIYGVALSTIYRINRGEIWNTNDDYPLRKNNQLARKGQDNGRGTFTNEEVIEIRKKYVNKSVNELYEEYKDKCSLSGFKKVVQGATYKHLPIYKKSIKTWINCPVETISVVGE